MSEGDRDADGERFRRREWDYLMKFLPTVVGTTLFALSAWGVSIEVRLNTLNAVQQERAPLLTKANEDISQLYDLVKDPSPKAETKVEMDSMQDNMKQLADRIDRMDERLSNLHQFLLQTMKPPQPVMPPSKRGMAPFTPEDRG